MNNFPKRQILINYVLGICTSDEREEVEEWLDKEPDSIRLLQQVASELKGKELLLPSEKEEIVQNLYRRMEEDKSIRRDQISQIPSRSRSTPKLIFSSGPQLWLKVAAVILVIVTAGLSGIYFNTQFVTESEESISFKRRSLPNGQRATLSFGEGSVIKLNGGSTLRYPKRFAEDRREVYLEGEAFFSVSRDESRPFIVHTGETTIRVLGTSFNIKAYQSDDELQVVVAEGKVAVSQASADISSVDNRDTVILEKDQWVTYRSEERVMERGEGDISEMIAWKDDILIFNNKTFEEGARMMERWYGVDIRFESEELKDIVLQGKHKDVTLEGVLNSIQYITGMEYELDGEVVRIY